MFKNRFFRKIFHPRFEYIDQVKLVYNLSLVVGQRSSRSRGRDDRYYVGFISKSRIYTTYRELLIHFSEE
jgi:hypothetical protein